MHLAWGQRLGTEAADPRLPVLRVGFYFLASRFLLVLVAWLSTLAIRPGEFFMDNSPLGLLNRWDAGWYLKIASHGYYYLPDAQSSVAFFPLYPLLIWLAGLPFGDPRIGGYIVSNLALLGACLLLWCLVARQYGSPAAADRAVLFLLFNPVTVFYSSIYTESLFLLLMLAVAWLAAEQRWLTAGVCGYLLALCRPVGIIAMLLLAAEYARAAWRSGRWRGDRPGAFLAGLLLFPAGLAAYGAFLGLRFGHPLGFLETEIHWSRRTVPFWQVFSSADIYPPFYRYWFYGSFIVALGLVALCFFLRLRLSHLLLTTVFLLLYASAAPLESTPRFLSVLFPFYIAMGLATVRWPRLEAPLFAASAMLMTLSLLLFVNGYWFT